MRSCSPQAIFTASGFIWKQGDQRVLSFWSCFFKESISTSSQGVKWGCFDTGLRFGTAFRRRLLTMQRPLMMATCLPPRAQQPLCSGKGGRCTVREWVVGLTVNRSLSPLCQTPKRASSRHPLHRAEGIAARQNSGDSADRTAGGTANCHAEDAWLETLPL